MNSQNPYEYIGKERLEALVHTFYAHVQSHPLLKPIFPDDLTETARKQIQFLTQFLGGPELYTSEHGHPMLRARHIPFEITAERAQAWLFCMNKALDETQLHGDFREYLIRRLALTAHHMVNTPDDKENT